MDTHSKTAAQLEMEVAEQRDRLESRVLEIKERLSAGQLLDEFLNYARAAGGADFVANLGRSVQANPLPVALTGVGLAWLMARANAPATSTEASDREWDRRLADNGQSFERNEPLPFARIKGTSLRRLRQMTDEAGQRYSEFTDEAGARFKAMSDEMGGRAGQFADESGKVYRGFIDEAGDRVRDFLDESGSRIEDARGWTSEKWESATSRLSEFGGAVANRAGTVADRAADLGRRATGVGSRLQSNAGSMGKGALGLLQEQPLIGAALAFAVGAAIASALPPTRQEDELLGAPADQLKAKGAKVVGNAYEQGKEKVSEAFEEAQDQAASLYGRVKQDLAEGATAEDKARLH